MPIIDNNLSAFVQSDISPLSTLSEYLSGMGDEPYNHTKK